MDAKKILAIDIGAGTQDILLYEEGVPMENCIKLILPSMSTIIARRIRQATHQGKDIFLSGNLMGGGPNVSAIKAHLRAGFRVFAIPLAAKTIRDDPTEVEALGVHIVESPPPSEVVNIELHDVDLDSLRRALGLFDISLPGCYAIAVQDHGECLGMSQRRFRFQQWEALLKAGGALEDLAYTDVPLQLTRMRAVQRDAPGAILMDTGAAAVWGVLSDPQVAVRRDDGFVLLNIGNQHTLGALVQGRRIWGLFEHHTVFMNQEKLRRLVNRLSEGTITDEEIYSDRGHGSFIHPQYKGAFTFVTVTGPRRVMAEELGYHKAAPYGDMMLTGAFGLIEAARSLKKRTE